MTGKIAKIYIVVTMLVSCMAIVLLVLNGEQMSGQVQTQALEESSPAEHTEQQGWQKSDSSLLQDTIQLRLPEGSSLEAVSIENLYMQKTLQLTIREVEQAQAAQDYYRTYPILENAGVEQTEVTSEKGEVTITLVLGSVCEWETAFETDEDGVGILTLSCMRPRDQYEKIVVLDAGHGGEDKGAVGAAEAGGEAVLEKDIALSIVRKAGELLEEEQVKVYYTRTGDENPTPKDRVRLANDIQADLLVSIHADYAEDTGIYGMQTIYNDTFFIPDFGSADLGYVLLEKAAARTNEKALGMQPDGGQTYLLQNATVPVAQLNVGYLSNAQEVKLLGREDYLQRAAQGICDGIMAAYEEMQ